MRNTYHLRRQHLQKRAKTAPTIASQQARIIRGRPPAGALESSRSRGLSWVAGRGFAPLSTESRSRRWLVAARSFGGERADDARSDHGARHQDDRGDRSMRSRWSARCARSRSSSIQPQRTSDLFCGLPSVWFRERGDTPETAINIRGLQDFGRVAVVVDGARQNFQRSGHNANGAVLPRPRTGRRRSTWCAARSRTSTARARSAAWCRSAPRTSRTCCGPASARARSPMRRSASNQARGLGSFFGAGAAESECRRDRRAAPTAATRTTRTATATIVPNSGYEAGDRPRQGHGPPGRGHEVKLGAITAGLPLPHRAERAATRSRSIAPMW